MFENIDLKDAVRRAMQTEKNAMDFYRRGAEMMKNAEAKKVFELLAREEGEHAEWFYNVYPGDDIADLQEFLNAGADQEKSRGGNIRWHIDTGGLQRPSPLQGYDALFIGHLVAKAAQHALGVIARGRRLRDSGFTLRIKPRQ